jgi:C1A family cysteine protease
VLLVGYNDEIRYNMGKGCMLAQNSWSTSYGMGGFFWIPYKYFSDALAIDTWSATSINWVNTGVFS